VGLQFTVLSSSGRKTWASFLLPVSSWTSGQLPCAYNAYILGAAGWHCDNPRSGKVGWQAMRIGFEGKIVATVLSRAYDHPPDTLSLRLSCRRGC
jgi:hypothetical protein